MKKWTKFMDMHSGGGLKEDWQFIYIEAPIKEAKIIFYNKFGHNPERVTCTCCGDDYSIDEYDSLEIASAFNRGCRYDDRLKKYVEEKGTDGLFEYKTLEEYTKSEDVLIIRNSDIKPEERQGEIPIQGYVWID